MAHRVLLVEDDPDARYIYASCLKHAGFDVIQASTAREAAEAAQKKTPEVVVLDRRLPDRDGLDLARQWRRFATTAMARVPIIVLTAFTARTDVEAALDAGCDVFLGKPCPGHVLAGQVASLCVQPVRPKPSRSR
jgi:DNA-binding response OmpR family regulator